MAYIKFIVTFCALLFAIIFGKQAMAEEAVVKKLQAYAVVPGAIEVNSSTIQKVWVRPEPYMPGTAKIWLEKLNTQGKPVKSFMLRDDGRAGDEFKNDNNYTAKFKFKEKKVGDYYYRLRAKTPKGNVYSEKFSIEVTPKGFPNEASPSQAKFITDEFGGRAVAGELIVRFKKGTSLEKIISIVKKNGGKIIGRIPEIRHYQIKISDNPAVMRKLKKAYEKIPQVEGAFYNTVMSSL